MGAKRVQPYFGLAGERQRRRWGRPRTQEGNSPSLRKGRVSTLKLLPPLPAAAIVEPPKPLPPSPQPPAGEWAEVEVAEEVGTIIAAAAAAAARALQEEAA